jgi:hypothetical protein
MSEDFEDFEHDVIATILSCNCDGVEILQEQYKYSTVIGRKFTGCGFFTEFIIKDPEKRLPNGENYELSCLGEIENISSSVGFILFVRNGFISTLEGYTYGDELWPTRILSYRLFLP